MNALLAGDGTQDHQITAMVTRTEPPAAALPRRTGEGGAGRAGERTLFMALDLYLREIGRTPLLTREQELDLAQRVEQGDGDAATALVQANLRLVVHVAHRYANRGLPLEDLVAEGNMGLLHAVKKFEWRRGFRFSTYAIWWINQSITRAIADTGHTIRLPVHVGDALARRSRTIGRLEADLGREPTAAEIDTAVGADASLINAAVAVAPLPLSLDRPVGEDGDSRLVDLVPDAALTPEDSTVARVTTEEIARLMRDVLSSRESAVLTRRFGLDGGAPETLGEVGRRLGVTRERVRQIENDALRKLRRPAVTARLRAS